MDTNEKGLVEDVVCSISCLKDMHDAEYREILAGCGDGKIVSTQIVALIHELVRLGIIRRGTL